MDEDTGMVLGAALAGAIFVLLLALLAVVHFRRWWPQRSEAIASNGGFVLFEVCCQDGSQQRRVVRPSLDRNRRWSLRRGAGEGADDQEPDACELDRWKRMFGGLTRSLSTIDEGTEKGTTPITTPAFCSPAASPDRRGARTLQMASGALRS